MNAKTEATLARTTMRRMALVTVAAGIAAIGGLTTAPLAQAAPAAQATGDTATLIPGNGNGGPDAFLVYADGSRTPIFFCDPAKPEQRHNNCIDVTGNRF